jgi:hypothetical protein
MHGTAKGNDLRIEGLGIFGGFLVQEVSAMVLRKTIILLGVFVVVGCASTEHHLEQIRSQHPDWNETTVQKVAAREVELGMMPEMVEAALGKPDAITREKDEETWGYEVIIDNFAHAWRKLVYFVHFKDGRVVRTTGDRSRLQYAR